jgi:hypothetical protein
MLMHLIPPHRLFSAKGVPATGLSGVISSLLHGLSFLQIRTFETPYLP